MMLMQPRSRSDHSSGFPLPVWCTKPVRFGSAHHRDSRLLSRRRAKGGTTTAGLKSASWRLGSPTEKGSGGWRRWTTTAAPKATLDALGDSNVQQCTTKGCETGGECSRRMFCAGQGSIFALCFPSDLLALLSAHVLNLTKPLEKIVANKRDSPAEPRFVALSVFPVLKPPSPIAGGVSGPSNRFFCSSPGVLGPEPGSVGGREPLALSWSWDHSEPAAFAKLLETSSWWSLSNACKPVEVEAREEEATACSKAERWSVERGWRGRVVIDPKLG